MQIKSFFGKEQVPLVTARSLFSEHGISVILFFVLVYFIKEAFNPSWVRYM